jgi:hypothetical protein
VGYKVTAECAAHIPVETPEGRMLTTLYKNSVLPEGVPQDRIDHLLSVGAIERTDEAAPTMAEMEPNLAEVGGGGSESGGESTGSTETPYDDPERVAAREKLPEDGSLPDGRAAHPVWVEAAVKNGYDYKAAKASTKPELMELLRSK